MTSIARQHFQRATAAAAAAAADPGQPVNANAYELQLLRLNEDKRRLKDIKSIERKIEVKRALLPEYVPYVDGVLQAGRGGQDAILTTIMVWRIDTGDVVGALEIARYALEHNLAMPDQYQRDVPTILAEETAEQALQAIAANGTYDLGPLQEAERLTASHDMPDEVRAKLHKALAVVGSHGLTDDKPDIPSAAAALDHYRRALQLHERVGVKKDIERLERFLKNHSPSDPPADPAGDPPGE